VSDVVEMLARDARSWASGRSPWLRAALLSYLAYAGARHVEAGVRGEYRSWFAGITLAFHELGHLVLAPFGRTMMLLGGSLFQVLIPIAAGVYLLLRQHDWFGLPVAGVWLATSLFELSSYVDDANRNNLPLVGMGDNVIHDWDALLTEHHLLNHAQTFAGLIRASAIGALALSIALGLWLLFAMVPPPRTSGPSRG